MHGPVSATVNAPTAVTIGELGTSEPSIWAVASLMLMLLTGGWWLRRR